MKKRETFYALFGIVIIFAISACSAISQEIAVDMRYSVLHPEPSADYLKWSIGSKRMNDYYDAITGASVAKSTSEFDTVRYDSMSTRRYTIPRAIRHILLFPLSSRAYTSNFNLTVKEEGKHLVILFIVDGVAYKILTDDKKKINIDNACFLAKDITESNTLPSTIKQEYVKTGSDPTIISSLDWNKIPFVPDTAAFNASRKYSGILSAGYKKGVLTINGVLRPLPR
jgi:hypothetical protein